MFSLPIDAYSTWLLQAQSAGEFREGGVPPERWLQQVWRHQRVLRDRLATQDGRRFLVLHPGFWNREPGPDFRNALIQFEGEEARHGDVELDLMVSGWRSHQHDRNPAYRNVVLRVVWEMAEKKERMDPPILVLRPVMDTPIHEGASWLAMESMPQLPTNVPGKCSGPLGLISAGRTTELLEMAAMSRLKRKAAEMGARARHDGWEQVLWENLAAGLGYKQNVWPMRRLAEILRWPTPEQRRPEDGGPMVLQARLLGLGSFLIGEADRVRVDPYVRSLWDGWWRDRDEWGSRRLPPAAWRMAGIRPANHPHRRLALMSHWWLSPETLQRIEEWMTEPLEPVDASLSLLERLQPVEPDPFWETHWTLGSEQFHRAQPLLGMPRCTDLAMNAVLPWLWMRAALGREETLRARVEARFLGWPAGEDNAVLRLARDRLFGGVLPKKLPRTAAMQQGILQVVRDFCDRSDALCRECEFPALLRSLGES